MVEKSPQFFIRENSDKRFTRTINRGNSRTCRDGKRD
jgi:hypothetical protein